MAKEMAAVRNALTKSGIAMIGCGCLCFLLLGVAVVIFGLFGGGG